MIHKMTEFLKVQCGVVALFVVAEEDCSKTSLITVDSQDDVESVC